MSNSVDAAPDANEWTASGRRGSLADAQPFTDLARRVLRAPVAMLLDGAAAGSALRCVSADSPDDLVSFANRLVADIPGADEGDVLVVGDLPSRDWSDEDRTTLRGIADCLGRLASQPRIDDTHGDVVVGATTASRERTTTLVDGNHDLRTSLQGIVGLTELLRKETPAATIAAHAQTIQSAAEALTSLVGWSRAASTAPNGSAATDPVAASRDDATSESAHILIADDLDLNRKLICDMLSLEGHIVDSVADGASAVKAAGETAYDLILMDMIMPGMDGVAATRAIRSLPSPACEVPIVALTAHSLPEQLDSCLEAGMDATLTKPMTMDALNGAVATWTRRRRKAA